MKKIFNIFAIAALAMGFVACEETTPTSSAKDDVVSLTADKAEILADGVDAVTFSAKVNGEANGEVQIISLKDNSVLEGNTFTTTEAGEYKFMAAYGKVSSAVVTVVATAVEVPAPEIILSADKSEITADAVDAVTFTVKVDGEDKSADCEIFNLNFNVAIEGNTFTSDVAGEFKFKAKYEEWESNEVTVTANALPEHKTLKIMATPNRIKADGVEEAVFTVTYGEDDVTADAEIYNTKTNEVIASKKFSSTEVGSYTFRANYDGQTTGTSATVEVYDPALVGKYEIGSLYEANGSKGIIYAIKTDNNGITWGYIFSLDEEDLQWSTVYEWCNSTNEKGAWNTYDPFDYFGMDIANYPAFKWCMDHGEDWFLPSSTELHWMWDTITNGEHDFRAFSVAEWNKLIADNGGEPFVETFYWSSNETAEDLVEVVAFMDKSVICLDPKKDNTYTARAVYRFQIE